jgi:single-strand DNA-binding protein
VNETTLTITGNLTGPPELKFTGSGAALCRFTVAATPRHYDTKTGEWKDGEPLFLQCTAWRDLAENVAESLTKGTRVVVTGRLRMSQWETETGERRMAYGLDVEDIGASLRFAHVEVRKLSRSTAARDTEPAQ